ncbi:hypothetical protein [Actinacidiphila rubida]|nr:hypothetical protein [Actinacidiphila rubida]
MIDTSAAVTMAGILGDTKSLGDQINSLLITTVMSIMCSAFVIMEWARSRSILKAFIAVIAAGALWWGVMNVTVFRDKAGQDIQNPSGAMGAVVQVDPIAGARR